MSDYVIDWDNAVQHITDKLVAWDDLSPKMQKLLLEFYQREQQGLKNYWGLWGGTYNALERRGLVEDKSEVTYINGGQCVEYNFGLTDLGNRLIAHTVKSSPTPSHEDAP